MRQAFVYLLGILAVAVFAFLTYLISEVVVIRGVEKLEQQHAEENLLQLNNHLSSVELQMRKRVMDWACWDEVYEYVDERDEDFIRSNFEDGFLTSQNISFVYFFRDAEKPFKIVDPKKATRDGAFRTARNDVVARLVKTLNSGEQDWLSGFVKIGDEVNVIAIHRIYDGNQQKEPKGYLIMGQALDRDFVAEAERFTRKTFNFLPLAAFDNPALEAQGDIKLAITENLFSVITRCKDIFHEPSWCLELNIERSIARVGRQMSFKNFLLMLGLGLALLIVGMTVLHYNEQAAMRREIAYRENHDSLTGLYNKNFLLEHLATILADNSRHVTVIVVDIDRFKSVNESYGHKFGDLLLFEVASRFWKLPFQGFAGRSGGDEFLLFSECESRDEAEIIGNLVLKAFDTAFDISGQSIFLSASIGIACAPEDGQDAHKLLQRAELAMYAAKSAGKNILSFFNVRMDEEASKRMALEAALHRAVEENALTVFYQPKVDGIRRRVVGLEALVRWHLDDGRWIPPSAFIPVAEEINLVARIDMLVLRKACRQVKVWAAEGCAVPVSVNMSAKSILAETFAEEVQKIITSEGTDPSLIEVEVTETCLVTNLDVASKAIAQLTNAGIQVSLDDFGTGYSSLLYLHALPIACLKIDKKFIDDLNAQANSSNNLVKGILGLASGLGMETVAEGVEERSQLDFLTDNGCAVIQGYFFSKPLNAQDCENFLFSQRQRFDEILGTT